MTEIISAIVVVAGFAFWLWRRYGSVAAKIARLKKQIGKILEEQQDALEDGDMVRFNYLDNERLRLGNEIANLRGQQSTGNPDDAR